MSSPRPELTEEFLFRVGKLVMETRLTREKFLNSENKPVDEEPWSFFADFYREWRFSSKDVRKNAHDAMKELFTTYEIVREEWEKEQDIWKRPWPGEKN